VQHPKQHTTTPGSIPRVFWPAVLGLAAAGLACGQATAVAPTSSAVPTAARTAQPTPAPLLWATDDLSAHVQEEARRWAEARGLSFIIGPASGVTASSVAGGLAWVVSLHEATWAEDPAFIEAGVRGVVVDPTGIPPSTSVSTIGASDASWKEAGFLAGVMTGLIGESQVAGVVAEDDMWGGDLAAGFDQGLRYTCPRCRQVRAEGSTLDVREFAQQGIEGVFVAPGGQAEDVAAALEEGGLWVVWVGALPSEAIHERLAGRVLLEPEALVAKALDALAAGEGGQSWPYSVGPGGMALGDLNPQAISPGRQRLADEAEQKLASGALDLNSP
jgi:hypothetical protein